MKAQRDYLRLAGIVSRATYPFIAGVAVITIIMTILASNAQAHAGRNLVGAWYFQAPAPFAPHLATFHDDGTVVVMFPDAAEAGRSASTGAGAWKRVHNNVYRGTFYEINASRDTNTFQSDLIVEFQITVIGNKFTGTATASYFDADGNLLEGPYEGPLTGTRIEA